MPDDVLASLQQVAIDRSGDVVGRIVETVYWQGFEDRSKSEIIAVVLEKSDRVKAAV